MESDTSKSVTVIEPSSNVCPSTTGVIVYEVAPAIKGSSSNAKSSRNAYLFTVPKYNKIGCIA